MIQYSRHAEWRLQFNELVDFLARWYGPLVSDDGLPSQALSELRLPAPLRMFYEKVGNKHEIITQNRLLMPSQVRYSNEGIEFYQEAQHLGWWIAALDSENPTVLMHLAHETPRVQIESERLCGFLFQMAIYEAVEGATVGYRLAAYAPRDAIAEMLSHWRTCALAPWRWPVDPTVFLYAGNAIGYLSARKDGTVYFQCGARDANALEFMAPYVTDRREWNPV